MRSRGQPSQVLISTRLIVRSVMFLSNQGSKGREHSRGSERSVLEEFIVSHSQSGFFLSQSFGSEAAPGSCDLEPADLVKVLFFKLSWKTCCGGTINCNIEATAKRQSSV